MLEQHDWNNTPDTNEPPTSHLDVSIKDAKFEVVGDDQYCVASLQLQVDNPPELRGITYFHRIFIGNKNDPGANTLATWDHGRGAMDLKKMQIAVCGDVARLTGNHVADLAMTIGYPVGVSVTNKPDKNGVERGYFNKWWNMYDPQKPQAQILHDSASGPPRTAAMRPPGAAPMAQAPQAPQAPQARPPQAPQQMAPPQMQQMPPQAPQAQAPQQYAQPQGGNNIAPQQYAAPPTQAPLPPPMPGGGLPPQQR